VIHRSVGISTRSRGPLPCSCCLVRAQLQRNVFCGDEPTCKAYPTSEVVFIGTATEISHENGKGYVAKLRVTEVLRGVVLADVEFSVGEECDASFRAGQTYLVYAGRVGGRLITSGCSRTRPLEDAQEDLNGYVMRPESDDDDYPLSPLTVILEGPGRRFEVITRPGAGPFEINGVRPGAYRMRILLRDVTVFQARRVVLSAGECQDRGTIRIRSR